MAAPVGSANSLRCGPSVANSLAVVAACPTTYPQDEDNDLDRIVLHTTLSDQD